MPWVRIEASDDDSTRHEPSMTYVCDWPGCTRSAEHVAGCVKELGACAALCAEHANIGAVRDGPVKTGKHSYRPFRNV